MSAVVKKYRYKLDPSSQKFRCPSCKKKRFVQYKDLKTNEYLSKQYGRCDREVNCGYFSNPYTDGYINEKATESYLTERSQPEPKQVDHIPYKILRASRKEYRNNNFIEYLCSIFSDSTVINLITKYHIGTSTHWNGATIFWQIDQKGNIRTGKIMLYELNGHRKKTADYNYIHWAHSLHYGNDNIFNLEQCLFGEHLLINNSTSPIAIVESEKTAIIASAYFPEFIWLATGAKHNLKPEKCNALIGRDVTLFPDIGAFTDWKERAAQLNYFCNVSVSDLLEKHSGAKGKNKGYDLADYLTQYNINEFQNDKPIQNYKDPAPYGFNPYTGEIFDERGYPSDWDSVIQDEAQQRDQLN